MLTILYCGLSNFQNSWSSVYSIRRNFWQFLEKKKLIFVCYIAQKPLKLQFLSKHQIFCIFLFCNLYSFHIDHMRAINMKQTCNHRYLENCLLDRWLDIAILLFWNIETHLNRTCNKPLHKLKSYSGMINKIYLGLTKLSNLVKLRNDFFWKQIDYKLK